MQQSYFEEKINRNSEKQNKQTSKLNRLSTLRVLTFVLGCGVIIISNLYQYTMGYVVGAVLLGSFIGLVRIYNKTKEKKLYYEARQKVLEQYLERLGEGWKQFEENGELYKGEKSRVRDLDLLGRSSLYQYICTAHTIFGKRALAQAIIYGHNNPEEIEKRQEAVKELIEDENFALHLQTISMQINTQYKEDEEESLESFISEAESKKQYVSKGMKLLALGLPFATLFCIVIGILGYKSKQNFILGEIGVAIQIFIALFSAVKTSEIFKPIFKFNEDIGKYKEFLAALEGKTFTSSYLKELQSKLLVNGGAVKGIIALNKLTRSVKLRYNFVANMIVNGLFMWDVHCKDALEIWSKQYGKDIRKWLEVVGEIETLVSLAVIGRVKEMHCFPEIVASNTPMFQFEELAHPLIANEKVVSNSFEMAGMTAIITGSNMSGKTTFLRSIGVNLTLAYAGAPVAAKKLKASYMEVFTSMRIEDRVDEGISTFYAELLRIKEMIEYSDKNIPMLALIDEIFKGTNSADRILGATQTIRKLGKPCVNVMVTTHDFELCNLAEENMRKTRNYHFEEYYEKNQIKFDYKLKEGRCKTTNAKYLLKMVGIM